MTISLTDREIDMVLDACSQYMEILGVGEDTHDYTVYTIETGLGSALRKIGKGRNISNVYRKYKTVTNYPSFEEWMKMKREAENND